MRARAHNAMIATAGIKSAQRRAWKCESIVSLGSSLTRGLFLMFFARMPYLKTNHGRKSAVASPKTIAED